MQTNLLDILADLEYYKFGLETIMTITMYRELFRKYYE